MENNVINDEKIAENNDTEKLLEEEQIKEIKNKNTLFGRPHSKLTKNKMS